MKGVKGLKNKDSRISGFKGSSEKIVLKKRVELLYFFSMSYLNPRTLDSLNPF